jgi:hypothetical protein
MRRRRSEEEQRALLLRRGELMALAQHPSWPVLESVIDEQRQLYLSEIGHKIMTDSLTLSPERQAFIRGWMKGALYVLAVPMRNEAALERELRAQMNEEAA